MNSVKETVPFSSAVKTPSVTVPVIVAHAAFGVACSVKVLLAAGKAFAIPTRLSSDRTG